MKKLLTYCLFVCATTIIYAQVLPIRDLYLYRDVQKESVSINNKTHSSFKNIYYSDYKHISKENSCNSLYYDTLKNHHTISILPATLLLNGFDFNSKNFISYNKFGLDLRYSHKDNIAISILPTIALYKMPEYIYTNNPYKRILNGETLEKNIKNINYATDIEGVITYKPYSFLSLELANSSLGFGDGYRSFLLNNNVSNYKYFKLETEFLDIKYSCVWANLSNIDINNRYSKFAVFHYFDWSITNRFNLGLFESIITSGQDFYSFEYLNPIIFFRPVEFNLGSEDNALLGINLRYSITNTSAIYGQFMIDDIIINQLKNDIKHRINPNFTGEYGWFANKWAGQIGYKIYDAFKINNLDLFTEINIARPYVYSHVNILQNYSHLHQSLAHPLGANFYESITGIKYLNNNFKIELKFMYALVGMDTLNSHFGQNIFQATMDGVQPYPYQVSSYYNTILQGDKTRIFTTQIDFMYFPFKNKLFAVNAGVLFRYYQPTIAPNNTTSWLYIGIKSNILDKDMVY